MRIGHMIYLVASAISAMGLFMLAREVYLGFTKGELITEQVVHVKNQPTFKAFEVLLQPSMNPIRAKVTVINATNMATESFNGSVFLGRNEVASHSFTFNDKDAAASQSSNAAFKVEEAGRYQYLSNASGNGNWANKMSVELFRNAHELEWRVLLKWLGVFLGAWAFAELIGDRPSFVQKMMEESEARRRDRI